MIKCKHIFFTTGFLALLITPFQASSSTLMLTRPAVSRTHIAFGYANDLWVANLDGSYPRRLTTAAGSEEAPYFSPDGKYIAFSGNYDGNTDVYLVPVEGGIPRRLTYHPYGDLVKGFSPDGKEVIFTSNRSAATQGRVRLYSVSTEGGYPEPLVLPYANKFTISPDGNHIAYTPWEEVYRQWKHYRGGTHTEIWIFSKKTREVVKVPQPEGRCNDTDPFWIGDVIFFLSDRNGEFNLFSYHVPSRKIRPLTTHRDFPILHLNAGAGNLVYERAGRIFHFDRATGESKPIPVSIATDLREVRERFAGDPRFIRSGDISPSGARVVFGYRGEVVTVPSEKGDMRNITQTVAEHDRFPAWSPDGKSIAYFSDPGGEYRLIIAPQDSRGQTKTFPLEGAGFYSGISWAPDSQKLCFTDNSRALFWLDIRTGEITRITREPHYTPGTYSSALPRWSHDSNWITYHRNNTAEMSQAYVYSVKTRKSRLLTDGLSDVSEPVFDPGGEYIYFLVSTDAGPVKHWFDQSNADKRMTSTVYLATLQKETRSPLAKESDEEEGEKTDTVPGKKGGDLGTESKEKPELRIDFQDFERRIIALPIPPARISNLQVGKPGEIYYLEYDPSQRSSVLHRYDLGKRQKESLGEGILSYKLSGDHQKILLQYRQEWAVVSAGKITPGSGRLAVDKISVRVDPRAEWAQIFHEAWRVNRDYFYDPGMQGADWQAMYEKYDPFVDHLSCRADLNRLIRWMCSELAVGHHRGGGGDFIDTARTIPGGLLGADYEIVDNRYRFRKVYGGLNWNQDLRSPLAEPGVNVRAGEFLLAVNGRSLEYPDNIFRHFENTAGKIVELTIGSDVRGTSTRKVKVVPIGQEFSLRNRDWVEKNLAYVTEKTNGRVAYVYVPNTAGMGHTYFKRYFYPQSDREAIIVDERFNGGGSIADYYVDMLKKTYNCSFAYRYGKDGHYPTSAIFGPKVLLINEMAGSGGDLFPWMWRQAGLGKIIGTRTWGGLVGVLGFPVLMDGGMFTAPNVGFYTEESGFAVENEGVPPDIEVEQVPRLVIEGKDPQLDRAIAEILKDLEKNPQRQPKRPPFPVRVKK